MKTPTVNAAPPIYITDMSQCQPSSSLSDVPAGDKWHVVPYEAAEVKGKMLCAQSLVQAPEVTLPLNVKGWHAISIGFWPGIYYDSRVKYRLSGEDIFTVIDYYDKPGAGGGPLMWNRTDILESVPRYADLTNQNIVFAKQLHSTQTFKAFIAYVKLEPLSEAQVAEILKDRSRTDTRKVVALLDGDTFFIQHVPYTKNELLEVVEPYRYSDVGLVFWGVCLGDLTYYPSKVGRFCYTDNDNFCLQLRKEAAESYKALAKQGVVPWKAAMDHVHAMGLEFHTYYRLSMYDHANPCNIFTTESHFLAEHPECRIVAKDGTPLPKASYAFPETRNFMVRMMEEAMAEGVDGVCLCNIRGPEYFGYEKPIIDDFLKLYHQDPRQLPDDDPRLLKLRATYMTEFLREVRRTADKHGKKQGKRIQVSIWIEAMEERMEYFSYDCYTWLEEKMLDLIFAENPPRLLQLAKEKGCRIYIPMTNGSCTMDQQIAAMHSALLKDLDGIAIWDIDNNAEFVPDSWAVVSRLGHREEVAYAAPYRPYPQMKRMQLLAVANRDISHTETKKVPFCWPPEMLVVYSGG